MFKQKQLKNKKMKIILKNGKDKKKEKMIINI